MLTLHSGVKLICPHCLSEQEDNVENYVIPGKTGRASAAVDECWKCNGVFEVVTQADGSFEVEKL